MKDSRVDTYQHIHTVQRYLMVVIEELQRRLLDHDMTKLLSPEREAYDGLEERLRQFEYGSEGYRENLRKIKPAIQHHYAHTKHHPESFKDGIHGMSLVDLTEMIVDWAAAARRHPNGSILRSMDHNQERFGFSDELKGILINTVHALGLEEEEE